MKELNGYFVIRPEQYEDSFGGTRERKRVYFFNTSKPRIDVGLLSAIEEKIGCPKLNPDCYKNTPLTRDEVEFSHLQIEVCRGKAIRCLLHNSDGYTLYMCLYNGLKVVEKPCFHIPCEKVTIFNI